MSFHFDLPNATRFIAIVSSKYVDEIVNNLKKNFQKKQQDNSDIEAIMTQDEIDMYDEMESYKITFCGFLPNLKKQKQTIEYQPKKKMDYGNFIIVDMSEEQILSI
jgi:hypothetical protein